MEECTCLLSTYVGEYGEHNINSTLIMLTAVYRWT